MAAPINVTVTSLSESVQVTGASSESVSIANGGGVAVAIGTVAVGDSLVTAGTVQVGKVTTLSPGSNATVVNSGTGIAAVLDFGIPTGAAGPAGATGPAGKDGVDGINGKDGVTPAFAIGTVSTLAAGSVATVTATPSNSGANVTLDFGIPRGDPGEGGGSSVSLSDGNPAALGATASPGTSSLASRADHVHAVPVISYASLTNVPSTFAPAAHQHAISDVTGLETALDSKSATSHGHNYVTALNSLTGSLTLAAGSNVTITPSGSTLTIASTASGVGLSDAMPQPLGIAAVGTSTDAAREDHVHAMPTAMDVGALGPDSIVDGGEYIGMIVTTTPTITITAQPVSTTATVSGGTVTWSESAPAEPLVAFALLGSTLIGMDRQYGNRIYKYDGSQWNAQFLSGSSTSTAYSVMGYGAAIGSTYVLFGVNPTQSRIAVSQNAGQTWTISTRGPFTGAASSGGRIVANAVSAGTSGLDWPAIGAEFHATDDGVNWSMVGTSGQENRAFSDIRHANGRFLAVGEEQLWSNQTGGYYKRPICATSTNGLIWSTALMTANTGVSGARLFPASVAYGSGRWVAVGRTNPGNIVSAEPQGPFSAYSNTDTATVCVSTDNGATWQDVPNALPVAAKWNSISYANGYFLAIAETGAYYAVSADGLTWTEQANNTNRTTLGTLSPPVWDGANWYVSGNTNTGHYGIVITPAVTGGTLQATFTVGATLTPSGSLSYQWQKSDDAGATWANVSGGTASTLTVGSLTEQADNSDQYRVVVSATNAASVTSNAATLTVPSVSGAELFAWGSNESGQLGDGSTTSTTTPTQIGDSQWLKVEADWSRSFGIKTNGTLYAWGNNDYGQLGDGTLTNRLSPVQIGSSQWSAIACGLHHTLGVRSDGALFAWGRNQSRQIGDGTTVDRWSPTQVVSGQFTTVAANHYSSFAIRSDGRLFGWGGSIWNSDSNTQATPAQIGSSFWAKVSANFGYMVLIRDDGALFASGVNTYGQLADGTNTDRYSLAQIGSSPWSHVSAGQSHVLAIRADGSLFAWGRNDIGQLGDGTTTDRNTPTQIGSSQWLSVSAGNISHAIRSDGALFAWGGAYGNSPTQIGTGTWSAVSRGNSHTLAISAA